MDLAYIVYIGLLVSLLMFSIVDLQYSTNSGHSFTPNILRRLLLLTSIIVFSFVIGLRDNVGLDWIGYKYELWDFLRTGSTRKNLEIGYLLIFQFIKYFELHFSFLFICTAFLQIFYLYKRGIEFYNIFPLLIIFYFTMGNFIYSMNIMRQMIAFSIIFYGTRYIIKEDFIKWLGFVIFACFFHISAIITLPFYFLRSNLFKNRFSLLFFLLGIYTVTRYVLENKLDDLMITANILFGRDTSIESLSSQDRIVEGRNNGSGLFDLAEFLIYSFFIYYYFECGEKFKKYGFYLFFNLTAIGIVLFPLVSYNILFDRLFYYFLGFKFVIFSFYVYFFIRFKKEAAFNVFGYAIILIYFLFFLKQIGSGSNLCAPFSFL